MKYTPMQPPCDLCKATFDAAMATMDIPIYLHVHPSLMDRAAEVLALRDLTPSKVVLGYPRHVEAIADSTLAPHEWYLVTAIGSAPAE